MLFNFELRPLERIIPFERKGDYSFDWFGLTDGWYWLSCGNDELFRYHESIVSKPPTGWNPHERPYVDYFVAQLWDDVQDHLTHFLEPIPSTLLRMMEPGREAEKWRQEVAERVFPDERDMPESMETSFDIATTWLFHRRLPTGHLKAGPRIWFWTEGSTVFIRWDNEDLLLDNRQLWASGSGTWSIPLNTFVSELESFSDRLISVMHNRVESFRVHLGRSEARIGHDDLLLRDHHVWVNRMRKTIDAAKSTHQRTDWAEVIKAIEQFLS